MMDPRKLHSDYGLDERLAEADCAYCGGAPETVDHVPSKAFLDDPLPDNLPVVPACKTCNGSFSQDEEYLACFLGCVLSGTADPDRVRRPKIARTLRHSPRLATLIAGTCTSLDGQLIWTPDAKRVENVLLKLARGHHLYELASPQHEAPETLAFGPLITISPESRREFESGADFAGWPEIGSRAFLRAVGVGPYTQSAGEWVEVQQGRYRYRVEDGSRVRIVLGEYLACAVTWG